jgi:DNA polymerase-3 subunit delta'
MSIILHPLTARQLDQVKERTPQTLMLIGPRGVGKMAIAQNLAADLLGMSTAALEKYAYCTTLAPDKPESISIDAVRSFQGFLTLKVPSSAAVSRIAIIEDAHLLTTEAQNALLKTLEEPPEATVLILTVAHQQALLPTIRSRAQTVMIHPAPENDLRVYFEQAGYLPEAITKALLMSGSLPGMSSALLAADTGHPLNVAAETARTILRATTFERLALVDTLAKQRQALMDILYILQQMARAALRGSANTKQSALWTTILQQAYRAEEQLIHNGQAKLVLTNLMLSL